MSYSEKICRNIFSLEQEDIVIYTLFDSRPELNVPPVNPNIIINDYDYVIVDGDDDEVLNPGELFNLSVSLENLKLLDDDLLNCAILF